MNGTDNNEPYYSVLTDDNIALYNKYLLDLRGMPTLFFVADLRIRNDRRNSRIAPIIRHSEGVQIRSACFGGGWVVLWAFDSGQNVPYWKNGGIILSGLCRAFLSANNNE
jgi:hypothetical protein